MWIGLRICRYVVRQEKCLGGLKGKSDGVVGWLMESWNYCARIVGMG
jgi:hypothetical protein